MNEQAAQTWPRMLQVQLILSWSRMDYMTLRVLEKTLLSNSVVC